MGSSTSTTYLSISFFILFSLLTSSFTDAATFEIRNQCPYTVWAAAMPGGGRRLERGQSWFLNVNAGTAGGRIWGRTNCNFDGSGRGRCQTGDCAGVLECRLSGATPATLAEYTLGGAQDFFDISLVDGFNLPMVFSGCRSLTCSADINGQCPNHLRVPGGCRNPPGSDGPTDNSRFFKARCPDAYSYPKDDTATKACPGGTNYRVVFCP